MKAAIIITVFLLSMVGLSHAAVKGNFEGYKIGSTDTLSMWAYEDTAPTRMLYTRLLDNATGQFICQPWTDITRPDVNTKFGITGTHGASCTILPELITMWKGQTRKVLWIVYSNYPSSSAYTVMRNDMGQTPFDLTFPGGVPPQTCSTKNCIVCSDGAITCP